MGRPQVIRFSDDATLTLLGADYGTRHAVPGGKLPKGTTAPAATGFGGRGAAQVGRTGNDSFTTPNSSLVVWVHAKFEYDQNHYQ